MVRIRNKRTLVEKNVPERAVQYFPDFEVIEPGAPTETKPRQTSKPRKRAAAAPQAKQSETPAAVDTDTEE